MKLTSFALLSLLTASIASQSQACDLCGCYTPKLETAPDKSYGFYAGVGEQFTHFGTILVDGQEVNDPSGQYLDSSITQFVIGSTFFERRLSLQVNIPYIYRSYKRPEGFEIEHGNESGLGDISVLLNWRVFKKEALFHEEPGSLSKDGKSALPATRGEPDFVATFNVLAGLKLPTGDSSRLREEFNEVEVEGAPESGIHGHDLTLGTGGYDAILGAQFDVRYKALFFEADTQFTLRGDGLHQYHFANDLTWSGGPGVYVIRNPSGSLALQCVISGEYKDTDRFQGRVAEDTGITSVFVGPRLLASFRHFSAEVGLDLPVSIENTALQAVPDYRIRGGLSVSF